MKFLIKCPACSNNVKVIKTVIHESYSDKQVRIQSVKCTSCGLKGSASNVIEYKWHSIGND